MGVFNFVLVFSVILKTSFSALPPSSLPSPSTPAVPCNDQFNTPYWYEMLQCSEDPQHPGVWIQTNLDPFNCEGYCNYTILTPPPPPSPTSPIPCEDQMYTPYWYEMMQCGEDPTHPGVWVSTNLDPYNCEGFCNHTALTPPTPSQPICDIVFLEGNCVDRKFGCKLNVINYELCITECVCPNCDEIFEKERLACEKQSFKQIFCSYDVSDPFKCQGNCVSSLIH